jgi:hypothetical protein
VTHSFKSRPGQTGREGSRGQYTPHRQTGPTLHHEYFEFVPLRDCSFTKHPLKESSAICSTYGDSHLQRSLLLGTSSTEFSLCSTLLLFRYKLRSLRSGNKKPDCLSAHRDRRQVRITPAVRWLLLDVAPFPSRDGGRC